TTDWLQPPEEEAGLRQYVRILRERIWIVVAAVVLTTSIAIVYVVTANKVYEATADLLITAVPGTYTTLSSLPLIHQSSDPTRDVETAAQLVTNVDVANRVKQELNSPKTANALLEKVTAEPVAQSNIVAVTAKGDSPQRPGPHDHHPDQCGRPVIAELAEDQAQHRRRAACWVGARHRWRIRVRVARPAPAARGAAEASVPTADPGAHPEKATADQQAARPDGPVAGRAGGLPDTPGNARSVAPRLGRRLLRDPRHRELLLRGQDDHGDQLGVVARLRWPQRDPHRGRPAKARDRAGTRCAGQVRDRERAHRQRGASGCARGNVHPRLELRPASGRLRRGVDQRSFLPAGRAGDDR